MKDADGHLFTSFIPAYTDDNGRAWPSHIADFFVYRDHSGSDKLFALSSDPNQRGFKFYVGVISHDRIDVDPELTLFTRSDRNVARHHTDILTAYGRWLTRNPLEQK